MPAAWLWESKAKGILGWEIYLLGMPFFVKGLKRDEMLLKYENRLT